MAEIVGVASSILAIVEILLKSTQELKDFVNTVRSAPKEIRFLIGETTTFTHILNCFYQIADEAMQWDDQDKKERRRFFRSVRKECDAVSSELAELVRRFQAINPLRNPPARVIWTRIVWTFNKQNPDFVERYLMGAKRKSERILRDEPLQATTREAARQHSDHVSMP